MISIFFGGEMGENFYDFLILENLSLSLLLIFFISRHFYDDGSCIDVL